MSVHLAWGDAQHAPRLARNAEPHRRTDNRVSPRSRPMEAQPGGIHEPVTLAGPLHATVGIRARFGISQHSPRLPRCAVRERRSPVCRLVRRPHWDAECRFTKRWLPELRDQSPEAILHHHDSPLSVYPPPIIEFASRTQKMKDALYSIRKSREAKSATPAVYQKHGSRKKELARTPRKPAKSKENPKQLRLFE